VEKLKPAVTEFDFEEGVATFYAMKNAEDRGVFFIHPGTKVYRG